MCTKFFVGSIQCIADYWSTSTYLRLRLGRLSLASSLAPLDILLFTSARSSDRTAGPPCRTAMHHGYLQIPVFCQTRATVFSKLPILLFPLTASVLLAGQQPGDNLYIRNVPSNWSDQVRSSFILLGTDAHRPARVCPCRVPAAFWVVASCQDQGLPWKLLSMYLSPSA